MARHRGLQRTGWRGSRIRAMFTVSTGGLTLRAAFQGRPQWSGSPRPAHFER